MRAWVKLSLTTGHLIDMVMATAKMYSQNWVREAQRTGELFLGRPQVRPGIDFGRAKKTANVRSCRKNYTKPYSQSHGLFIVQCECRNPKLIGVSVMRECEGVSTALSVLLSRFQKLPRVCKTLTKINLINSDDDDNYKDWQHIPMKENSNDL